jgi:N-acyl-D-aspartate/D-glutamate deacylase
MPGMAYDLVVKNALIVDGTGAKGYKGDIAVQDGRIVALGSVSGEAKHTIDAGGQVAAPGFIDAHSHYDGQLLWDPTIDPATSHGVTTILMGNCGFTLAPVRPKDQDYLLGVFSATEEVPKSALLQHAPLGWESFGQYMTFMEKIDLGVNVITQVGHSALRRYVMGEDALTREATTAEVDAMVRLAEEAMDDGAAGVSSSFSPAHVDESGGHVPSFIAAESEMEALAGAVRRKNKRLVSVNPRSKRDGLTKEDQAFLVRLAEASGAVVTWNDFGAQAPRWEETLTFMEKEIERGNQILVVARCQPLETRFTLDMISPLYSGSKAWLEFCRLDRDAKVAALNDAGWRERLSEYWNNVLRYLDNAYVERMGRADLQHLVGRKLTDIAEERGIGVVDTMFDIFRDDRMEPFILLRSKLQSDETNAERILKSPAAIVGISDGGAHLQTFSGADYPTYFLSHWVRDKRAFTIEEGVAALTSRAAEFVGLKDRGTLEVGKAADITIFNPDTIASEGLEILDFPGGGSRLRKNATGIPHVIVNGVPIIENGVLTGAVPGQMIRA